MAGPGALDPDADLRLILRAGLSQDDHSIQRLGIQPGDEVNVPRAVLLPKLANLNLGDAHKAGFDCRGTNEVCQLPPSNLLQSVRNRVRILPATHLEKSSHPPANRQIPFQVMKSVEISRE